MFGRNLKKEFKPWQPGPAINPFFCKKNIFRTFPSEVKAFLAINHHERYKFIPSTNFK